MFFNMYKIPHRSISLLKQQYTRNHRLLIAFAREIITMQVLILPCVDRQTNESAYSIRITVR